jgi:hypothetical protein
VLLLDNKQKSANIEVDVPSSPRTEKLLKPKSDFEKRKDEVKELLGDTDDSLPF